MLIKKYHIFLLAAVAITASLLYFYFDPSYSRFFPACPFFTLTGLFCPGCGSQRAFHDLLHLDLPGAASHNLGFVIAIPLIAFSAFVTLHNLFFANKRSQRIFYSPAFAKGVLIFVLAFWIIRNIPVAPLSWLAP